MKCLPSVWQRCSTGIRRNFVIIDFIQADSEEAFNDYLDHIIQLSVFTGTDLPVYGDELLTLSTCNNFYRRRKTVSGGEEMQGSRVKAWDRA